MDTEMQMINVRFMQAIKSNDLVLVENFLHDGVDVNFVNHRSKNETPLHEAVTVGNLNIIRLLLANGADYKARNNDNKTPMELCSALDDEARQTMEALFQDYRSKQTVVKPNQPESIETGSMDICFIKRPGIASVGQLYEVRLLTMVLFRLLHYSNFKSFYLGNTIEEAGAFNDVVLRTRDYGGKSRVQCLQAKHKKAKHTINLDDMINLKDTKGDFNLRKYFESFLNIRYMFSSTSNNPIFHGKYEGIELRLIVFTPAVINISSYAVQLESTDRNDIFHTNQTGKTIRIRPTREILESFETISKNWHKSKNILGNAWDNIHYVLVNDFFAKFRIYSGQVTEDKLNYIVRNDIRTQNYKNDDFVFSKAYSAVENWWKQHGKVTYLSKTCDIFKMAASEIDVDELHAVGLNMMGVNHIKFNQSELEKFYAFFSPNTVQTDNHFFYNIYSKTPQLCCIKLIQYLKWQRIDFKFVLINDLEIVQTLEVYSRSNPECLAVAYITGNVDEISTKVNQKVKKVIVITKQEFSGHWQSIQDETVGLLDLETDNQEKLLENSVQFQGYSIPLRTLIDEAPRSLIDGITLEKLVSGEKLIISKSCCSKDLDDSSDYYIERVLLDNRRRKQVSNAITEVCDDVVIIAAEAGMGKSTLLTELAREIKKSNPYIWIIRIDLLDYTRMFFEWNKQNIVMGKHHAINLLMEAMTAGQNLPFEQKIFQWYCEQPKINLLIDGFDEISPDYTKMVLQLLNIYKHNFTAKLWVTTRTGGVEKELENSLKVQSYSMQPFTPEETKLFLWKFWSKKLNITFNQRILFENYFKLLLSHLSQSIEKEEMELISVPLHIKMIAIIFQENFKVYCDSDGQDVQFEKLDSISLYEKLIDMKYYKILIEEKHKNDLTKPHNIRQNKENFKQFQKKHKHAAICAIFNQTEMDSLNFQNEDEIMDEFLPEVLSSAEKAGIISNVDNGKPQFQHRTVAEFYAAEVLWEKYSSLQDEDFKSFVKNVLIGSLVKNERTQIAKFLQDRVQEKIKNCMNVTHKACVVLDNLLNIALDSWREFSNKSYSHLLSIVECSLNVESGCFSKLESLVKTKGDNIRDMLLLKASENGHIGLVCLVIGDSSDRINITFNWLDGWTALHFAADGGHKTIVEYLVSKSANINNVTVENKQTALHLAAEKGYNDIVQILLNEGAEVSSTSIGITPLHLAAEEGSLETVSILLDKKETNINGITLEDGETALHKAATKGNLEVVRLLIKHGADVNIGTRKDGSTPLHVATKANHTAIVRALLETQNSDAKAKTNDLGLTALHIAVQQNLFMMVHILIREGFDVNSTTNLGETPLHFAVLANNAEIARLLFDNKAKPNEKNSEGMTPLHLAALNNFYEVSEILLKRGADFENKTTKDCKTPMELAEERGNSIIVQLLKKRIN